MEAFVVFVIFITAIAAFLSKFFGEISKNKELVRVSIQHHAEYEALRKQRALLLQPEPGSGTSK